MAASEEPWDISLDSAHTLWLLQPCQEKPVAVYTCTRQGDKTLQVCITWYCSCCL